MLEIKRYLSKRNVLNLFKTIRKNEFQISEAEINGNWFFIIYMDGQAFVFVKQINCNASMQRLCLNTDKLKKKRRVNEQEQNIINVILDNFKKFDNLWYERNLLLETLADYIEARKEITGISFNDAKVLLELFIDEKMKG